MKILELLNNKFLSILLIILVFGLDIKAEEKPIDIWNINENETEEIKSAILSAFRRLNFPF